MKKIAIPFILLVLLATPWSAASMPATDQQLVATVNGVNLNLDWSAMPPAPSYTLYYALADYRGKIDVNTIGSIEMGNAKSLYVPGLPSGLIIYAAVMAHTDAGDILSNIEKFMGFAGTITIPDRGNTLLRVDDPGGVGSWSVNGSRTADGKLIINEVSYDPGNGPLLMKISDNRLAAISQGGQAAKIIYQGEQPVAFQAVNPAVMTSMSLYSTNGGNPLCSQYEDRDSYEAALNHCSESPYKQVQDQLSSEILKSGIPSRLVELYEPPSERISDDNNVLSATLDLILLSSNALNQKSRQVLEKIIMEIKGYVWIVYTVMDGMREEIVQQMLAAYDQQCMGPGVYVQQPDKGNVFLSTACQVPTGAREFNSGQYHYYTLGGKTVGPYNSWLDAGRTQRYQSFCRDANGVKQGWFIQYNRNDDSKVRTAIKFLNGQNIIEYQFFDSGPLQFLINRDQNGGFISSFQYNEGGHLLRYCNRTKCVDY